MDAPVNNVLMAFGLTLFAGLATGVGSAIAFFARRTNYRMLAFSLSFSAGVMLYVSFTEILKKSEHALTAIHGARAGAWLTAAGFFGGLFLIALIDRFIPSVENPHEVRAINEVESLKEEVAGAAELNGDSARVDAARLMRMGKFAALAIAIHNFPEGLATFFAALDNPHVGLVIAVAIALHNIPEGVSVSVPIYYATGSRRRAFWLSLLSGVSEPVGAFLGYFVLRAFFTPTVSGMVFGLVAGVMVFISLDELLPTAREYSAGHEVVYGITGGMALMALSLLLLT